MKNYLCKSLCTLCLAIAPTAIMADTLLGVYYGNQGWNMTQVKAMETWQSKRNALLTLFTNWSNTTTTLDNLFKQQLPNIWQNGNVPVITWEPYTNGSQTPTDIESRIAIGEFDAYIDTWASRLKTFLSGPDGVYGSADDRRVYMRLAHEMNGNWYPWSAAVGNNNPSDFVDMWQRVVSLFQMKGLDFTHVQWIWSVNSTDIGAFTAEQFYPGDAFVDWISMDGYNWGTSQSWSTWKAPNEIYDNMLARLRQLTTKPVALSEFATTSAMPFGADIDKKLLWISDMFKYALDNDIRMVSWFNQDKTVSNKVLDWAIFGGIFGDETYSSSTKVYKAYSSYRDSISNMAFTSSDLTNPRLLTDNQFIGN